MPREQQELRFGDSYNIYKYDSMFEKGLRNIQEAGDGQTYICVNYSTKNDGKSQQWAKRTGPTCISVCACLLHVPQI